MSPMIVLANGGHAGVHGLGAQAVLGTVVIAAATVAGILAQAARISLRSAFHSATGLRAVLSAPAVAAVVTAAVTTVAVHLAG